MFNGAITLLVFSENNFEWALDDGKGNPNVKILEVSMSTIKYPKINY